MLGWLASTDLEIRRTNMIIWPIQKKLKGSVIKPPDSILFWKTARGLKKVVNVVNKRFQRGKFIWIMELFEIRIQIWIIHLFSLKNSRPCRDLNPGPLWYQADMLPIELSWLGFIIRSLPNMLLDLLARSKSGRELELVKNNSKLPHSLLRISWPEIDKKFIHQQLSTYWQLHRWKLIHQK